MLGAPARHTSARCGSGPPLGYWPGWCPGRIERRVQEHRQRVLLLAGRGDGLRVAREVPGHEDFLARRPAAEDLRPGAARPAARAEPRRAQLRRERVALRRQVGRELRRHGRGEGALGRGAVVARGRDHPDLVLDLDHQHRVRVAVELAQVPQQRRERAGVGLAVLARERRQDLLRRAVEVGRSGEAAHVALHPRGGVAGHAVLPRPEPEQDELHPVAAGVGDQPVHRREVEPLLLGLDEVPVDGRQDGVEVRAPRGAASTAAGTRGSKRWSSRARRRGSGRACRRRSAAPRCPGGAGVAARRRRRRPARRGRR